MIHYTVRENARSTRASLKITPHEGLVVVIPPKYGQKKIPKLLREKRQWIEKHLPQYENAKNKWQHKEAQPSQIELKAIEETWQIQYGTNAALKELGHVLQIHTSAWLPMIKRWITEKAKVSLKEKLDSISLETGLSYSKLNIRNQKSRWGSCSSKNEISLNMKLLFLPPHLVTHIMVHELAHTKHLNHSRDFWALVEKHDPDYKKHNNELKEALFYIPHWLQTNTQGQKEILEW